MTRLTLDLTTTTRPHYTIDKDISLEMFRGITTLFMFRSIMIVEILV